MPSKKPRTRKHLRKTEPPVKELVKRRLELFKSQDAERGGFDVTFEFKEKRIFAHKVYLTSVSEYFAVHFSGRWENQEAITIDEYSYENFFQFLCFVYSGECDLTFENAFELVKMADYYGIPFFNKYADDFLYQDNAPYELEELDEYLDFAKKYSLRNFEKGVKRSIESKFCYHFDTYYEESHFLKLRKSVVQLLLACKNLKNAKILPAVYKWVENQAVMKKDEDKDLDVAAYIKAEMVELFSNVHLENMKYTSFFDFIAENDAFGVNALEFAMKCARDVAEFEHFFQRANQWAEKRALEEQNTSDDPNNFDLKAAISANLTPLFLYIWKLDKKSLNSIFIRKGVITQEEANNLCTLEAICGDVNCVKGTFIDIYGIGWGSYCNDSQTTGRVMRSIGGPFGSVRREVREKKKPYSTRANMKQRYTGIKCQIPSTPSPLSVMKGNDWYLVFEHDGVLALKHRSLIDKKKDYLIAEMKPETEAFSIQPGTFTPLKLRYVNGLDFEEDAEKKVLTRYEYESEEASEEEENDEEVEYDD